MTPLRGLTGKVLGAARQLSSEEAAKRRLPSGRVSDELLVKLFQYTAYTLPPNEPLSEILIPELRKLSEASRLSLGAKWHDEIQPDGDAKPVWLCSPALVAMGVLSALQQRDRFQDEMPLLIEAIRAEYPQLIRATALACIDTMSYEAELAAPHVEQLLTDESRTIRTIAAFALVSIRLDHADAAKIAKAAGLSAAEKDDLDEYCQMKVESTLFAFENESDFELLGGVLKQNQPRESYELRFALRQIEHAGPMAASYQDDIRQHLRSSDVLTRKLAQRALKSIQGTTDR